MARNASAHIYTPTEDAEIIRLHATGLGASVVAQRLGFTTGQSFTKGQIIRRFRTLGIAKADAPRDRKRERLAHSSGEPRKRSHHARPKPTPLPSLATPVPQSSPEATTVAPPVAQPQRPARIIVLDNHRCTWALNNEAPWIFCEAPCCQTTGFGGLPVWSSWCAKHHRIVYVSRARPMEAA